MTQQFIDRDYRKTYRDFTIVSKKGSKSISAYINGIKFCTKQTIPAIKKEIDKFYSFIEM